MLYRNVTVRAVTVASAAHPAGTVAEVFIREDPLRLTMEATCLQLQAMRSPLQNRFLRDMLLTHEMLVLASIINGTVCEIPTTGVVVENMGKSGVRCISDFVKGSSACCHFIVKTTSQKA